MKNAGVDGPRQPQMQLAAEAAAQAVALCAIRCIVAAGVRDTMLTLQDTVCAAGHSS
jgi:hypothetical protein